VRQHDFAARAIVFRLFLPTPARDKGGGASRTFALADPSMRCAMRRGQPCCG
jgi:hypothetical protein